MGCDIQSWNALGLVNILSVPASLRPFMRKKRAQCYLRPVLDLLTCSCSMAGLLQDGM
jgi:hypothetical protein